MKFNQADLDAYFDDKYQSSLEDDSDLEDSETIEHEIVTCNICGNDHYLDLACEYCDTLEEQW